jgi:hypothetical protein
MTKEEVRATLVARGEEMVDTVQRQITAVQIEFNLENNTTNFDVRAGLAKVLTEMKKVDNTAFVGAQHSTKLWQNAAELPKGDEFQQSIPHRAIHPPRSNSRVMVYITLYSTERFNVIKHDAKMMAFLKQQKVWIKVDKFQTKQVANPGFLMHLHPNLVRMDVLWDDIVSDIKTLKPDNYNTTYAAWLSRQTMEITANEHPVPDFRLVSGKRAFGAGDGRVSTNVILIECAQEDALVIKLVFSRLYKSEEIQDKRGIFVPSGIHLMENPAIYRALLRKQNQYLSNITAVIIEGLKYESLACQVTVNNQTGTMGELFESAANVIESMEKTNLTEEKGKWILVCTKDKMQQVCEFIDGPIKDLYLTQIPAEMKYPEYETPERAISGSRIVTVGNDYASILKGICNLEETSGNKHSNTDKDMYKEAPPRPKKRQNIDLTFTNDTAFPPLQATTNTDNNSQATPSTQITQDTTTQATLTSFEERLNNLDKTIQEKIDQVNVETDKKLNALLETVNLKFNSILSNFDKSSQDMRELIQAVNARVNTTQNTTHVTPEKPPAGSHSASLPNQSTLATALQVENSLSDGATA